MRYGLLPTDPRLRELTAEDAALEYERFLFFKEKTLLWCAKCEIKTYRDECPLCGNDDLNVGPTGDDLLDKLLEEDPEGQQKLDDLVPPKLPKPASPKTWRAKS